MAHNTLYEIVPSMRALLTVKSLTNALVVLGRVEDALNHHSLCESATGDEVPFETADRDKTVADLSRGYKSDNDRTVV